MYGSSNQDNHNTFVSTDPWSNSYTGHSDQYGPPDSYQQYGMPQRYNHSYGDYAPGSYGAGYTELEEDNYEGYDSNYDNYPPRDSFSGNSKSSTGNHWRDLAFLLLFVAHLVGMVVLLSWLLYVGQYRTPLPDSVNGTLPLQNVTISYSPYLEIPVEMAESVCIMVAAASISAFVYLQLFKKFPKPMIIAGAVVTVLTLVGLTAYYFVNQLFLYGAILLVMTIIFPVYFYLIRNRIPFAIVIMSAAIRIVNQFPGTQYTAFFCLLLQLGWTAFTGFVLYNIDVLSNNALYIALAFVFFSYYWVYEVILNIVHVTVCGVVGSWYFLNGTSAMPESPTKGALIRATTTSLGSVCFGGLILAVLRTIRAILNIAPQEYRECANCILSMIENSVRYFNEYAYCHVAIYGKSYITAARDTWSLIERAGLAMVVNDNILVGVFLVGSLFGAVVCGSVGFMLAFVFWDSLNPALLWWIGFVIGFMILSIVMQVIESAVKCLFVCYAEDPEPLQHHDSLLYNLLSHTNSQQEEMF
eukprot:TRINITY_DN8216_c0_g1_i1.p1 TRINITY_DN8216_c0_g1~~TRINITY_DN8216_c0_g1_i1.p1  ORF type:complete len:527 (+),score=62.85 TRINITY_DN8216_c0_g1_i1:44-1624(+)